ncbi:MAG: ankyrin repeat domain-containing protein [Bosea sp.]|jgi:ankyrin repeat protein|nr:ankyrin repeat domain-containing protein [Bosea sp. (in: a-proteobacteria)]
MRRLLRACAVLAGVLLMTGASEARNGLLEAAGRGDLAAVNRLIAAGADLEQRDGQRQTPLLLAVAGNHVAVAKALLAAGASPNAQAANQDTPWLLAGASGRTEIIAAMLPLKPDLTIRNRYGGNALIPACERAHVETAKLLLTSGIDVNHVNNLGWTCLLEIVILGDGGPRHQQVARLVLDAGADPNLPDKDGVSPLQHARKRGQNEVAKLITAAGGR